MHVKPTTYPISNFCEAIDRNEITVNRAYQRSPRVWPEAARSFLIETIILGYPVPKFYLYQKTDVKTKKTYKEIVDGQQRTFAIHDFYHDKFPLRKDIDNEYLVGRTYSNLEPKHQESFLNYSIDADLFLSATEDQVRESFRRMNSYTSPLNPEEQRHARYQGDFKWFVNELCLELQPYFSSFGIFSDKNLYRMADTKLVTEICHAIVNGISTTNKRSLDGMYKKYNDGFEQKNWIGPELFDFFHFLSNIQDIHNSILMKHYSIYSFALAYIHVSRGVESLNEWVDSSELSFLGNTEITNHLLSMIDAVENDIDDENFADLILSFSEKTNVRQQRATRFRWFCWALANYEN